MGQFLQDGKNVRLTSFSFSNVKIQFFNWFWMIVTCWLRKHLHLTLIRNRPCIRKWKWYVPLKWEAKLTNLNWPPLMDLNCGLVNQVCTCYTALHLLCFTKLGEAPGDYFWKFASSWNFCHFQVLEKNCERMRKLFVSDDLIGWKGLFESNWTYRVSQKNAT